MTNVSHKNVIYPKQLILWLLISTDCWLQKLVLYSCPNIGVPPLSFPLITDVDFSLGKKIQQRQKTPWHNHLFTTLSSECNVCNLCTDPYTDLYLSSCSMLWEYTIAVLGGYLFDTLRKCRRSYMEALTMYSLCPGQIELVCGPYSCSYVF